LGKTYNRIRNNWYLRRKNKYHIYQYDLDTIINTELYRGADYEKHSISTFNVWFENSFIITPDLQNIIGIDKHNKTRLIIEKLNQPDQRDHILSFGKHSTEIHTMLHHEQLNHLLVGDDD
jgi:hypothetical protein